MSKTYYNRSHEYVRVEDDVAIVGITNYAQSQLGDIVFVELPEDGREMEQGAEAAVVESVKAASEVYAPITGATVASNEDLADNPALANEDPEGDGWFFKMSIADADELNELMDAAAYEAFVKEES